MKKKASGWVGYVDGKPCWERAVDEYVELGSPPFLSVVVYKTKKDARRRFQDVRPVRLASE